MLCTTCKKSQCLHVTHLKEVIEDTSDGGKDMLPGIEPFADLQSEQKAAKPQNLIRTISTNKISFDLPINLRSVLLMDHSQRFNIVDGVAQLVPLLPVGALPCLQCYANDNWSEDIFLYQENFIVTLQRCIPAKGIITAKNII